MLAARITLSIETYEDKKSQCHSGKFEKLSKKNILQNNILGLSICVTGWNDPISSNFFDTYLNKYLDSFDRCNNGSSLHYFFCYDSMVCLKFLLNVIERLRVFNKEELIVFIIKEIRVPSRNRRFSERMGVYDPSRDFFIHDEPKIAFLNMTNFLVTEFLFRCHFLPGIPGIPSININELLVNYPKILHLYRLHRHYRELIPVTDMGLESVMWRKQQRQAILHCAHHSNDESKFQDEVDAEENILWRLVLSYCSPLMLLRVAPLVCTLWLRLASDKIIWKSMFDRMALSSNFDDVLLRMGNDNLYKMLVSYSQSVCSHDICSMVTRINIARRGEKKH